MTPTDRPTITSEIVTLSCAHEDGAILAVFGVTTKAEARECAARVGWSAVFDETDLSIADRCPAHSVSRARGK